MSQSHHLEQLRNLRWYKGHMTKFWSEDDYKNLEYVKQDVTEEEKELWIKQGYDPNTSWTGSMYSNKSEPPAFVKQFEEYFSEEFTNLTYTFYRMQTQDIMPEHVDHFRTYKKLFNVTEDQVVRILVLLEDWKPGHYLEINGIGITNWAAGDYIMWENDVPHAASNIGKLKDYRYTLQITATKKTHVKFDKLYSFNVDPSVDSNGEPEKYVVDRLRRAIFHNFGRPYQIYTGNKRIEAYDNMVLPDHTIDRLNQVGLNIYLYEPICAYDVDVKDDPARYTERYYSEFSEDIKLENIRSEELDSIIEFKNKNRLTNVRVHTCEYDINRCYPYYADKLDLVTDDIFLKAEHLQKPSNTHEYERCRDFTHKFISLSYRYTYHRHLISCYLAQTNDALMSWVFKSDLEHIDKSIWHDFDRIAKKKPDIHKNLVRGLSLLNERVPLNVDYGVSEPNIITDHYHKLVWPSGKPLSNPNIHVIEKYYKKVFCEIVGETRFAQPSANYSEKVYRPMFYSRPFVVAAPPYTLQYMREQGFMTFGDFWDESYDTIQCHENRMLKIFEIIDHINSLSMDQCISMYEAMAPILKHNLDKVRSLALPV